MRNQQIDTAKDCSSGRELGQMGTELEHLPQLGTSCSPRSYCFLATATAMPKRQFAGPESCWRFGCFTGCHGKVSRKQTDWMLRTVSTDPSTGTKWHEHAAPGFKQGPQVLQRCQKL